MEEKFKILKTREIRLSLTEEKRIDDEGTDKESEYIWWELWLYFAGEAILLGSGAKETMEQMMESIIELN